MHNCHTRRYHQKQNFVEGKIPNNTLMADVQDNIDVSSQTFLQNRQNTGTNINNANISTISRDPHSPRLCPRNKFSREINSADFKINTQYYPNTPNCLPSDAQVNLKHLILKLSP